MTNYTFNYESDSRRVLAVSNGLDSLSTPSLMSRLCTQVFLRPNVWPTAIVMAMATEYVAYPYGPCKQHRAIAFAQSYKTGYGEVSESSSSLHSFFTCIAIHVQPHSIIMPAALPSRNTTTQKARQDLIHNFTRLLVPPPPYQPAVCKWSMSHQVR